MAQYYSEIFHPQFHLYNTDSLCKKLKLAYHKEVNNYSGLSRCLHISI